MRRVFSAGQASMALNWTYMYGMANDPAESQIGGRGQGAPTARPGPSGRPGVNGSMALARQRAGSKNQDAAWKYISTSPASRSRRSTPSAPCRSGRARTTTPPWSRPTRRSCRSAKKQLGDLILRPQVESYNAISQALQAEIQRALLGDKDPQQALRRRGLKASSLLGS